MIRPTVSPNMMRRTTCNNTRRHTTSLTMIQTTASHNMIRPTAGHNMMINKARYSLLHMRTKLSHSMMGHMRHMKYFRVQIGVIYNVKESKLFIHGLKQLVGRCFLRHQGLNSICDLKPSLHDN